MKNCVLILWIITASATAQEYSTCSSWDELVGGKEFKYIPMVRISDPGTKEQPAYTGFWFYDVSSDGTMALTHDFTGMSHGGTRFITFLRNLASPRHVLDNPPESTVAYAQEQCND